MRPKVIIRRCDHYDPQGIARLLLEGMEELGVHPYGRTMLKPNCVIAHPELFPHSYTRKEFLEGAVIATNTVSENLKELSIGERSGITVPTRFCFKNAGYDELIEKYRLNAYYFDECRNVGVPLKNPSRLREKVFVPEPVANCDFLINLPKFKAHPWTKITLGQKNFIGLQDDSYRLLDHNSFLEHKIADLQEVIRPGFIAIDAITAGQKMMLTPTPFDMGAVFMGTNPCAVDAVGCKAVGLDPWSVDHLKLSSERGFGPLDLEDIDITGDFPLDELIAKCRNFEFCIERIDNYFNSETSKLNCVVGQFPEAHSKNYCWGGCPGALQESMHIFRMYYPTVDDFMRKVRYVVGELDGPLDLAPDEKVLFVGDCTKWEGYIDGEKVKIESSYVDPSTAEPVSNDMIMKMAISIFDCLKNGSKRYLHVKGCPVSVASHITYLAHLGKIPNVNFDRRNLIPINLAYWKMRLARFRNHVGF